MSWVVDLCFSLQDIEAQLPDLKKDIVEYFTEREGVELKVASIYVEVLNKRDVGQVSNVVEHIHGVKYITDNIHGLKFRISPESFFQVWDDQKMMRNVNNDWFVL